MRAVLILVGAMLPAPVFGGSQDCGAATDAAWREGFAAGVEAVNAQLGTVTAQIQADVQAQVNAQLARLEQDRLRELDSRLAEAQAGALAAQNPAAAPLRMPALPPRSAGPGQAHGFDSPGALPPGTTITITDPQHLPPELFRALMDHAAR